MASELNVEIYPLVISGNRKIYHLVPGFFQKNPFQKDFPIAVFDTGRCGTILGRQWDSG